MGSHRAAQARLHPEPSTKGSSWQFRTALNGVGVVVVLVLSPCELRACAKLG